MTADIELTAGDADNGVRVVVSPVAGARVRRIVVTDGGRDVDLLALVAEENPRSSSWGSYPMAPWAGRIRNGRFRFFGEDIGLDLNHQDGAGAGGGPLFPHHPAPVGDIEPHDRTRHAIHGTTFTREWTVDALTETTADLSCALTGSMAWPFPGIVRQRIVARQRGIDFTITIESVDGSVFPASCGWHPCFAKPTRLEFSPVAMYEQDQIGLPTGRVVEPPPGPWDDCFVNHQPVRLHYDRPSAAIVTVTSPTDHWVVYDRADDITCVEPQTGPPDSPNVRPELVAPGHPMRHTMSIDWE